MPDTNYNGHWTEGSNVYLMNAMDIFILGSTKDFWFQYSTWLNCHQNIFLICNEQWRYLIKQRKMLNSMKDISRNVANKTTSIRRKIAFALLNENKIIADSFISHTWLVILISITNEQFCTNQFMQNHTS